MDDEGHGLDGTQRHRGSAVEHAFRPHHLHVGIGGGHIKTHSDARLDYWDHCASKGGGGADQSHHIGEHIRNATYFQ